MTPSEFNEYHAIESRVAYMSGERISPDKKMREQLDELIKRVGSVFIPYPFPIKETADVLFANPELGRIFSVTVDGLETLPYRADITFDRWWAPFEVLLNLYAKELWHLRGKGKTADLFRRFAEEVVRPEITESKEEKLQTRLQEWISLIPLSVCRYAAVRMLLDREIKTASQYVFVRERAEEALGTDLFSLFEKEYVTEEDGVKKLSATNHHRAARKLIRVLKEEPLTFNSIPTSGITFEQRLEFILSAILYASRCERLHGDYFSPFVSEKSDPALYPHWYWFAETVYIFFLILLKRFIDFKGMVNPISSTDIMEYIGSVSQRFKEAFYPEKKTE